MKPSDNTILVTGGGSGIGRGMARWWAEHGNTVIVAGRNAASLAETKGDNPAIHTMTLDASSAADITRMGSGNEHNTYIPEIHAIFPAH